MDSKNIELLAKELREAETAHETAAESERKAAKEASNCLKRLNDCQKAFDSKVAEMRKASVWSSEWGSQLRRGRPVES